jgi:hypothetical protein
MRRDCLFEMSIICAILKTNDVKKYLLSVTQRLLYCKVNLIGRNISSPIIFISILLQLKIILLQICTTIILKYMMLATLFSRGIAL